MENEEVIEAKDQQTTNDETEGTGTDPKEKQIDGDKLVKKLQKRIGKEQSEKHSLQEQLDKANEKLKAFQSGKTLKEMSDEDKAKKDQDAKDKEIASLRAQIARRDNIRQTDEVFREAGLTVSEDVLGMVVTDDNKQTFANVQALIKFINTVEDNVKKEYLKGSTPRTNGNPTMTKEEINKIKDPVARRRAIANNLKLFNH